MSKTKSELKLGINKYSLSNGVSKKEKEKDIRYGKYPNGLFPFLFILIIWFVIVMIGIFVTLLKWDDALSLASGISLLLNVIWWMGRFSFDKRMKYSLHNYSQKLKLNRLKLTEPYFNENFAIHNVNSYEDYVEYLDERSKRSSLMFYISIGLHTILFIVFLSITLANYFG